MIDYDVKLTKLRTIMDKKEDVIDRSTLMRDDPTEIHQQLLETCQLMFSQGHYQTAYYCLMAAFHHARDLEDIAALQSIEQIASKQSVWLEQNMPTQKREAQTRFLTYGILLYRSIAHQAHIQATLMQKQQHREGRDALFDN